MPTEDEIPPPPPPPAPPPSADSLLDEHARTFSQLVRNMFAEHEKRELAALERMERIIDLLVHDARGIHLQMATHATSIARTAQDVGALQERLMRLEEEVRVLSADIKRATTIEPSAA